MRFEVEISKEGVDKLLDCILKNKLEYDKLYIYERKNGGSDTIFNPNLTAKSADLGSCLTPTNNKFPGMDTVLITKERGEGGIVPNPDMVKAGDFAPTDHYGVRTVLLNQEKSL